jgi:type IV pilus assembly protein PilC
MAAFEYSAKDENGGNVRGVIDAVDAGEVARLLSRQRLYLLEAKPAKVAGSASSARPIKPNDLIEFTAYLRMLMQAGLPLIRCLEVLEEEAAPDLQPTVRDVRMRLMGGSSFGDALYAHARVFPEIYVSIVRAGEEAGTFDIALQEAERFIEAREAMKKSLRSATVYPGMLLGASIGVVLLLTTVVFPKILQMINSLNVELSLPTKIIMALSKGIQVVVPWAAVLGLGAVISYFVVKRRPAGRLMIDRWKLRVPFLGQVLIRLELARFARAAAPMFAAGVDLLKVLQAGATTVDNQALRGALLSALSRIQGGRQLSDALGDMNLFPRLFMTLLKVGEATGTLDATFDRTAAIYDREVQTRIGRALAILQPAVLLFMGIVVTTTALSLFMTIQTVMRQATVH